MVCFTPLGWITALFSALQLFGIKGLRSLLNPLWMMTLSNLIIKKVNENLFLIYSPLKGVKFLASDWDAVYIFYHVWLCRDYERFTEPKGVIVDCGAHVGLFTLRCLKKSYTNFVLAIEPNPLNVKLLRTNLSMNRVIDRAIIIEAAAGSSDGEIKLYLDTLSGRSSVVKKTTISVNVRQVKLDDLTYFSKVNFIKAEYMSRVCRVNKLIVNSFNNGYIECIKSVDYYIIQI